MKKNKKIIFYGGAVFVISFLTYSFFPVLNYKENFEEKSGRIVLYDRFGEIITDKQKKNGYFVKLEKEKYGNSKNFKNLEVIKNIVQIEDKNFYNHFGVNIFSKLRAIKNNIISKKIVSGGSTITEQYIKNKYFLGEKRTYLQKAREAFLAFNFSIFYSKQEILEKYLNEIYFGNNIYGIKSATKIYFEKQNLKDLNQEEITLLISLINNPGVKTLREKNFRNYFIKIKNRLNYNFENKILKLKKIKNIDKFPFVTKRALEEYNNNLEKNISSDQPSSLSKNGVKQEFEREIILHTTIDLKFQEFSKKMLNETLESLRGKNVTNGALVGFNPETMEVLIYLGSKDFYNKSIDGQVDVITSKRQLGSTLKPFLYLKALKNGANPDDFILDIQSEYNSFQKGKTYISENYSLKEYGLVRFKKAIGNSLNNASVRLAKELGLVEVWQFFKDYGLDLKYTAEHYGYSLVLGNPSISLENLSVSYVNLLPDFEINKDRNLNFILKNKKNNFGGNKIGKNKFLLYDILKNPDNRDISFGVNSILNTSILEAVKTGTSSNFRDNVVVSYNPNFILGIWIGNNDNSSMKGVTGITGAGYLWHQIIEEAIKKRIILDLDYDIPKGIKLRKYCLDKKCFRKELIYKKTGKGYKSSIIDNEYNYFDIFESLDDYEAKKLRNLNFNIKK